MNIKRITAALTASLMLALTACTEEKIGLTNAGDPVTTTTTTQETTVTTTTTAESSEQTTTQAQTTTTSKTTKKAQTTTTAPAPEALSGVKSAQDLIDLSQSIFKTDMTEAAKTVADSLGASLGKYRDELYDSGVEGRTYDQKASKMNVIGIAMSEMCIESCKNKDPSCGMLAFHLSKSDERGQITAEQAKTAYDTLYNQFKATYGEPVSTIEDSEAGGNKSDYSKYYWVHWRTPAGLVWLCWGTDLWGTSGYNNCIISVSHPDRE